MTTSTSPLTPESLRAFLAEARRLLASTGLRGSLILHVDDLELLLALPTHESELSRYSGGYRMDHRAHHAAWPSSDEDGWCVSLICSRPATHDDLAALLPGKEG